MLVGEQLTLLPLLKARERERERANGWHWTVCLVRVRSVHMQILLRGCVNEFVCKWCFWLAIPASTVGDGEVR